MNPYHTARCLRSSLQERRLTLTIPCVALLLSISSFSPVPTHGAEHTNFVLVMCDDLGWGDVGFNGGEIIRTPELDKMAAASMRFTRFYAAAPVCSPTRGSCMTGRHPFRYEIPFANSGHMKAEEITLAELLVRKGYATGHFGKWHLGTLTKDVLDANRGGKPGNEKHYSPPQDNGFQTCFSTESKVPTFDPMWKPTEKAGNAWDSISDVSKAFSYGTYYWNQKGQRVTDNLRGDNSRVIMDRVVPFLTQAARAEQPFFAVVWFHTPHLPVVAGPEHRALYPDATNVRAQNYYGCVTAMDEQMGRLRRTLRELGVEKNTMITFCSDNGPEGNAKDPGSAGPFRGRKRSLYEGGIRVPGLIEWPAVIQSGSTTDYPAVTSDYLPTILDIVHAQLGDQRPIDGQSLLPCLRGESTSRNQSIGFQSKGQVAYMDDQFKVFRRNDKSNWELYDLLADRGEKNDLAEKHPDRVQRMVAQAERWQASCDRSAQGEDY